MNRHSRIKVKDVVTVMSYLALAVGFVSVIRYIHAAYTALFLMMVTISLYLEKRRSFPRRWLLNLLSLLIVFIAFFMVDRDNLINTVVETLLILSGIKLMEDKKPRDHLQIYIISVFLIAGSALLTLNISFVLYLATFTFIFTSGIVMLTYQSEYESLVMEVETIIKILARAFLLPILSLPLSIFFFIILPRTDYHFLNFLNRQVARSGFTDTVSLGHISSIQEDASTAFRVKMERIEEADLYWRGTVLDFFDGSTWKVGQKTDEPFMPLQKRGVRQKVYLEPYDGSFLFAIDKPVYVSAENARLQEGDIFKVSGNVTRRLLYEAYSISTGVIPALEVDRTKYLQLPESGLERLRKLSRQFLKEDDEKTALSIMDYLRRGYSYTLKRLPISDNPVEEFLFDHRMGNCEYFASSMAILLRLNGIPSRLVGGYRGGHYNNMGGYYIISQRDAHVWVEAFIKGKGWVRYDPTPPAPVDLPKKKDILTKMRLVVDTINYYWNAFVITYDLSMQISLLTKMRNIKRPPVDLTVREFIRYAVPFMVFVIIVILGGLIIARERIPVERRLVMRFLRIIKRYGYVKMDSQGLEEFVSMIKEPLLRQKAMAFVREIEPYIFGRYPFTRRARQRLRELINDIKQ